MVQKLPKELQPSEHQIQAQLMQYLRSIGYYTMRLNSGRFSVGEGSSRRFINGQDAGTPDIVAFKGVMDHSVPNGIRRIELLFVEVKRPKGKVTPLQSAKMKELEEYGARCVVAHSIEELQSVLDN